MRKKLLSLALAASMFVTSAFAINTPESVFASDFTFAEVEGNNTFETANEVVINGTGTYDFSGNLENNDGGINGIKYSKDIDWVKLVFTNPGRFYVNKGDVNIYMYDSNMKMLAVPGSQPVYNGYCHSGDVVIYLKIFGSYAIDYTLTITEDETRLYEQEPNDDFKNATSLVDGQTVYGATEMALNDDYFRLDVPSGCYAEVMFGPAEATPVTMKYGWYLYITRAADGKIFTHGTIGTTTKVVVDNSTKFYEGTYYIKLACYETGNIDLYAFTTYINKFEGPKVKKVSSKKNSIKVNWEKNTDVSGYQLVYSTKKNFKKSKKLTYNDSKKCKAEIQKLTKNKKYYVKVRSFVTVNNTNYYSAWSKVKTIKTKK